jgi:hypothetical protein
MGQADDRMRPGRSVRTIDGRDVFDDHEARALAGYRPRGLATRRSRRRLGVGLLAFVLVVVILLPLALLISERI